MSINDNRALGMHKGRAVVQGSIRAGCRQRVPNTFLCRKPLTGRGTKPGMDRIDACVETLARAPGAAKSTEWPARCQPRSTGRTGQDGLDTVLRSGAHS